MRVLSTVSPTFLSWVMIVNLEPTVVEKYIIEVAFFFEMHDIAFTNTDFCLLFDLSSTQYPEILCNFAVRLHFDRGKKKRFTKLYHLSVCSLPQLIYGSAEQLRSHYISVSGGPSSTSSVLCLPSFNHLLI